jgi:hypothetical protein
MRRIVALLFVAACAIAPRPVAASPATPPPPSPDVAAITAVVRDFFVAWSTNDATAFAKATVPDPQAASLLNAEAKNTDEQASAMREEAASIDVRLVPALAMLHSPPSAGPMPVGTRLAFSTGFHGQWMVGPVVRTPDGWRVDTRYWVEMRRMAQARDPMDDPRMVAKRFLYAVLANDLDELNAVSTRKVEGAEVGIPNGLPGGDLDQILSLAIEMPVVRARDGEVVVLPSGDRLVATASADDAVYVGLHGPVEVPFHLRRIKGAWKVEPQDYFSALRALGAI